MSDEKSPTIAVIEAHEEFIQHIESGSSKIKTLSAVTIGVAAFLFASYLYQLVLPYVSGTTSVEVSLTDPLFQAAELGLLLLTLIWLYVAVKDYTFAKKMSGAIRDARALEKEIEKRIAS